MNEEFNSSGGEMLSDIRTVKSRRDNRRSRMPRISIPRFTRRVRYRESTESLFGTILSLIMSTIFIFPIVALMVSLAPRPILTVLGIVILINWMYTRDWRFPLILLGCIAVILGLGFVSLLFWMALFS